MNNEVPVYLVSLASDQARRETLAERFPGSFQEMIHVQAVDGRVMSARDYFLRLATSGSMVKRLISPVEMACSLSHVNALKLFLESGHETAIILEDDVEGSDEVLATARADTKMLQPHQVLALGGQEGLRRRRDILGKPTQREGVFQLPRSSAAHVLRTCCYGVTRQSAERIIECQERRLRLADAWGEFCAEGGIELLFAKRFSHPEDLGASHIEQGRAGAQQVRAHSFRRRLLKLRRKLGVQLSRLKGYHPCA